MTTPQFLNVRHPLRMRIGSSLITSPTSSHVKHQDSEQVDELSKLRFRFACVQKPGEPWMVIMSGFLGSSPRILALMPQPSDM